MASNFSEDTLCVGYTWEVLVPKIDKEMCGMNHHEDPTLEVRVEKNQGCWSVRSGTPAVRESSQSGERPRQRRVSRSQNGQVGREDSMSSISSQIGLQTVRAIPSDESAFLSC